MSAVPPVLRPLARGMLVLVLVPWLMLAGMPAQALDLRIPAHPGASAECAQIWQRLRGLMPDLNVLEQGAHATAARRDRMLLDGELDADCGTIPAPNAGGILYSALPVYTVRVVLVARAEDRIEVGSAAALRAASLEAPILLNRGSQFRALLEKLGIQAIDDAGAHTEQNVAKLLAGHGRLFVYQQPALDSKLTAAGLLGRVRVLPWSPGDVGYHMAYSPRLDPATVRRIEAALARLAQRGALGQTGAEDATPR
jgi:hypothetical protein